MLKEYGGMQNGGTPILQSSSRFTSITYYRNLHAPDTTREAFVTSKVGGGMLQIDAMALVFLSVHIYNLFITALHAGHPPNYLIGSSGINGTPNFRVLSWGFSFGYRLC